VIATTRSGQARESIKAAAWYVSSVSSPLMDVSLQRTYLRYQYGYQNKKECFSWLGVVYLNAIKAGEHFLFCTLDLTFTWGLEATLGGRKAPAVGTW
jgi:hypothetical protein